MVALANGSHGRQMRPPVPLVIIGLKKRAKGAVVVVVIVGLLVRLDVDEIRPCRYGGLLVQFQNDLADVTLRKKWR